jgi:anti-sigma factor RsiW
MSPEMNCGDARAQLDAYHDGELELAPSLALEEHLAACPACSQRYAALRLQSSRIRIEAPRYSAPASLRRRVEQMLPEKPTIKNKTRWHWGVPAAVAAALLLAIAFAFLFARPASDDDLAREVVALHTRAMMNSRPVEVASSDQHAVKPWFNTRVDFAPPVENYAAQGFELAGGRVDYLDNRRVAAVVYRQREHLIDVFIWPLDSARERAPARMTQRGFNIVRFDRGGMAHWLVSDLNAEDLGRLARLLQGQK